MATSRINLSVSEALKQRWLTYCHNKGYGPSRMFAAVVLHLTASEPIAPSEAAIVAVNTSPNKRIEIRLTESEHDAIAIRAANDGFSTNRWIVASLRYALTDLPQLGVGELQALAESNTKLLAIGRNLNQIARALNASLDEHARLRSGSIETLVTEIKSHTTAVSALIQSNVQRWSR